MRMEIGLEMELGMETDMNGVREGDGNGDGHEDGDGVVAWHREGGGDGNRWGMGIHEPGAGIGLAMGHTGVAVGPGGSPALFQPRCSSHRAQDSPFPGCLPWPSPAVMLGALPSPAQAELLKACSKQALQRSLLLFLIAWTLRRAIIIFPCDQNVSDYHKGCFRL